MAPFDPIYRTPTPTFQNNPKPLHFLSKTMASSSSSSSRKKNPTVSREEIKLFHTIDRAIFSRLVLNLRRDPGESMHVMAFLLCLEHCIEHAGNLVYDIQTWPDALINALADEAVQCLNCIRSDEFPLIHFNDANFVIPLIRKLIKNGVSLSFLHDNRFDIIGGIVKLVQDVCVQAFDDIMEEALRINSMAADEERVQQNSGVGDFADQNMGNQRVFRPNSDSGDSGFLHGFVPNELRIQKESLNNEMEELLNRIHIICINNKNKEEVAADDRTIFLTFSKGYPISEDEVTEFFTRKFGNNFIEGVEMQEAPAGKQPLFARLILHSASGLEKILNGKPKAKFSINGRHIWARKFVRKYFLNHYS